MPDGIRESDLAKELGFDRAALTKRRKNLRLGSEWWKDGAAIIWSVESADELRLSVGGASASRLALAVALHPSKDAPAIQEEVAVAEEVPEVGEVISIRVLKLARNDRFVLCAGDGVTVPVAVRRGAGPKLLGKVIRAQRSESGTLVHLR